MIFPFRLLHNIAEFPVLYSKSLLVIHFKYSSAYMSYRCPAVPALFTKCTFYPFPA